MMNQGKTARAIAETWPHPVVLVALAPPATAAVSRGTMSLGSSSCISPLVARGLVEVGRGELSSLTPRLAAREHGWKATC